MPYLKNLHRMKIDKSTSFLIFIFILSIIYFYPDLKDPYFMASNIIILILSFTGVIFNKNEYYSLKKMTYLFFFIFFGIIPVNDFINKNLYWGGSYINIEYYYECNLYIIIGLLSFWIANHFPIKITPRFYYYKINFIKNYNESHIKSFSIILISTVISCLIFAYKNYNFGNIFLRQSDFNFMDETIGINSIIFDYVIRPLPMVIFLLYYECFLIIKLKYNSIFHRLVGFYLFVIALIFVPPTGVTRFVAASLYIALMLLIFRKFFSRKYRLNISIFLGLFLIFPFLEKFRYFNNQKFNFYLNFDFLNQGHFDAYQNFVRSISAELITNGIQIIGVLLFWFPRALWPNKPEGSGFLLAEAEGLSLNNISFPYIAEGWVNFGVFGIIIFMFLWGLFVSTFDINFWEMKNKKINFFSTPYLLTFGIVFFIMRGNLLSSFSYSIGIILSSFIAINIFKYIFTKENNL